MEKQIGNKKDILLVDIDQALTQMLKMLLETRGYAVHIATSGKEALDQIKVTTDLVLLEIFLPDQQGFELCRKIRNNKTTAHIPIIFLSSKLQPHDIVEGLYLGADDFITKPFAYEELIARMEAVMRRSSIFYKNYFGNQNNEMIISELRHIVEQEAIVPFFQPIYFFNPAHLFGLEVLSRPKTSGILSSPEILFKAAIQYGFYQDLEMIAWRKAVQYASQHLTNEKLFLNCNPYLIEGERLLNIKSIFDQSQIKVENVVLEITERSAIMDYATFYQRLEDYRQHGFKFAIDDVGGGYASLEAIVQTKPEMLKIDRHIISNLKDDPFKKSIVKFIVSFCQENHILSIAEGIETKEELATVKELGVDGGQGYYLYKPNGEINLAKMNAVIEII